MIRKAIVRSLLVRAAGAALLLGALAGAATAAEPRFVRFETDEGPILLVMYPELAPHHVGNFTHLAVDRLLRRLGLPPHHPRLRDPGRRSQQQGPGPAQRRHGRAHPAGTS